MAVTKGGCTAPAGTICWRALRTHKLGFLQRSGWIWPHSLESLLREIIHGEGIPECFSGFTAHHTFLGTDAEIVETSWKWEEITRRQRGYEQGVPGRLKQIARAHNFMTLAAAARSERLAHQYAFELDPLLPRALWPKAYRGPETQHLHDRFRQGLRNRFRALTNG